MNEVGFVLEHDKATLCRTCYTTAHLSLSIGINNHTVYTCSSCECAHFPYNVQQTVCNGDFLVFPLKHQMFQNLNRQNILVKSIV